MHGTQIPHGHIVLLLLDEVMDELDVVQPAEVLEVRRRLLRDERDDCPQPACFQEWEIFERGVGTPVHAFLHGRKAKRRHHLRWRKVRHDPLRHFL